MKKIIALFVFIVTSSVYAQNSGITYQAVIYNPSTEILPGNNNPNVVLAAKDICLRFSISDANSSVEYQEVQKVKTDEFGMVNLIVGDGDQVSGYAANFDAIIWNSNNKNLKVEIDTNGNCTNFIEISNQKFASVPFAFASKVAETVSGIVPIVNGGTGAATVAGAKTNLGLNNVDNTSDLNKPVSTATQTALDAKAPLASPGFTGIPTAPTAAAGTSTTQIATTAFVNAALATAGSPDATATQKGRIQLAGDLGGTADAPTVPGLANKENAANKSTDTSLGNSDILFPTQKAVKTYVDNQVSSGVADATTSDKGKIQLAGDLGGTAVAPTITNAAVIGKVLTGFTPAAGTVVASDNLLQAIQKVDGNVALKQDNIALGTTSQYFRGDKTWQNLDKTAVGLNNVDNTSDANKPVSTATQTALSAKENAANKSDVTTLGLSDVLFPTQKAVKTYVDTEINAKATPDATASDKGKIQLGGDLAGTGSSAASPVISNNAISTNKIANDAVTTVKIAPGSNNSVLVTDGTGAVVWRDKSAFGAVADLTTIEGLGTPADPLKVKDLGISTAKIEDGAVTTAKLDDDAVTNIKLGETISVENGGTGATSLTGYLKGNGTNAFTAVSKIPVADVDGAVRKVNGVVPDTNGNVAVIIGRVFTGATVDPNLATSIINATPPKQQSDIYIVADGSNPNNGRTFIYDGTNWLEVATDLSATDARYVNVAGDTMEGNLTIPTNKDLIIADAPVNATDATNKAYVDGLVSSSATPDATTSILGKIKLAGDLGGTAAVPTVPGLAFKAPLASPSFTGTPLAPTAAAGTNNEQIATTEFVTAATAGKQNAITLTTTGTGAASLTGSTLNIPTPNNGTVTSVAALTLGTSGTDITSTVANSTNTPVITLNVPTASAANRGALSAADWTTFNDKVGGSGTANFVPKFSGTSPSKILENSSIFDNGTNVGIGTDSPANTLEIKQGTAGNSGLRLTNLTASSAATTASSKVLGVNNNGDVILTNVPGTQNIVTFSTATPTTSGVVFTPNLQADQSVVYQSTTDSSLWTYNGTTYVTYTPPATTAWNLTGTTNDAGNNKVSSIWRSAGITAGGISTTPRYGNLTAVGGTNFTGVPAYGTASIGLISNSIPGWSGSGFLFSNSTTGSNAFSMVYNADRAFFAQLTPTNTVTQLGNWGLGGLSIGSANASLSRLDVFGGLAVGSYAGTNAAPTNGLIVSGNLGVGTSSPDTRLQVNSASPATNTVNVEGVFRMQRPQSPAVKWENIAQFNLGSYSSSTTNATSRIDLAMSDGPNTNLSNVMTWQANGNVGFSTTAPLSLLSNATAGTNFVSSNSATQSATGISWLTNNAGYNTSLYNANNVVGSNGLQVKVANTSSQTIAFEVGQNTSQSGISNPYFNVLGNGNVGIGTNAPLTRLIVNDNAYIANLPSSSTNLMDNSTFRPLTRFQTSSGGNNNAISHYLTTTAAATQAHNYSIGTSLPYVLQPAGGNVGIGTTTPSRILDVVNQTSVHTGVIEAETPVTNSTTRAIAIRMRRGTFSAPAAIQNGDVSMFAFSGYDGAAFSPATAAIGGVATENWTSTNKGMALSFYSTPNTSAANNERMRIDHNGNIGIGTTAPAAQLHTTGSVRFAGAGTPAANRVLTSDASGNATWQSAPGTTSVRTITSSTPFSLALSDNAGFIIVNSASVVDVTVPSTLPAGFYCQIIQQGTGQVRLVGSGVTLNSALGFLTRAQGSSIGIMLATNTLGFVSGDTGL